MSLQAPAGSYARSAVIEVREDGRQRLYSANARALRPIHDWGSGYERMWSEHLGALDKLEQVARVRHHGVMRQLQMGARVKRCRGYTAPDWWRKVMSTSAAARPW